MYKITRVGFGRFKLDVISGDKTRDIAINGIPVKMSRVLTVFKFAAGKVTKIHWDPCQHVSNNILYTAIRLLKLSPGNTRLFEFAGSAAPFRGGTFHNRVSQTNIRKL